jgi:hypothetical protein
MIEGILDGSYAKYLKISDIRDSLFEIRNWITPGLGEQKQPALRAYRTAIVNLAYNLSMQLRRISSLLTVFHKYILPGIFAIGLVNVLFIDRSFITDPRSGMPAWVAFAIPTAFLSVTLWLGWAVKWVALDVPNQRLYVSNYLKEISIPFSEIADVSEFFFSDPRRITIKLHNPTEFGQKIVFLGTYRFGGIFAGPHPIVAELLSLAT